MRANATPALTPQAEPGLLRGIFQGWDRFWFTPSDPFVIGFIRLFCGLLVFYVHLTYSWDLLGYVGPEGWIDKETANYIQKDVPYYAMALDWSDNFKLIDNGSYAWSIYYHVHNPSLIVMIHIGILVSMMLFALGFWTRLTGIITWMGAMSYVQRSTTTVFGLDTMMMITLLYLQLAPAGAALSLDRWLAARKARRRGETLPPAEPSIAANFAIRLIQVHFCVIYFASGTSKLLGSTWWSGTSMNFVMLNAEFTPLENPLYYHTMRLLAQSRTVWEIAMTASIIYTLAVEISFGYLVWDRRWRWFMICCSVLLHIGIGFFMGLVTFSLMMLIMLSSFVPPETMRAVWKRLESKDKPAEDNATVREPERKGELVMSR